MAAMLRPSIGAPEPNSSWLSRHWSMALRPSPPTSTGQPAAR